MQSLMPIHWDTIYVYLFEMQIIKNGFTGLSRNGPLVSKLQLTTCHTNFAPRAQTANNNLYQIQELLETRSWHRAIQGGTSHSTWKFNCGRVVNSVQRNLSKRLLMQKKKHSNWSWCFVIISVTWDSIVVFTFFLYRPQLLKTRTTLFSG